MSKREDLEQFWSQCAGDLIERLGASPGGLTSAEAKRRLEFYGPNRLHTAKRTDALTLLLAQFKSPLILILLGAVVLSFFLGEPVDAIIIIAIVLLSSVLGFWQEKRATDAVKSLLAIVRIEARALRDGIDRFDGQEMAPNQGTRKSSGDFVKLVALLSQGLPTRERQRLVAVLLIPVVMQLV